MVDGKRRRDDRKCLIAKRQMLSLAAHQADRRTHIRLLRGDPEHRHRQVQPHSAAHVRREYRQQPAWAACHVEENVVRGRCDEAEERLQLSEIPDGLALGEVPRRRRETALAPAPHLAHHAKSAMVRPRTPAAATRVSPARRAER